MGHRPSFAAIFVALFYLWAYLCISEVTFQYYAGQHDADNGSFMTTLKDRPIVWLWRRIQNPFQSWTCSNCLLVSHWCYPFWTLSRASLPKFTAKNGLKPSFSKTKRDRHWLVEVQFCFMNDTAEGHRLRIRDSATLNIIP